jgi:hypothetical protein
VKAESRRDKKISDISCSNANVILHPPFRTKEIDQEELSELAGSSGVPVAV